MLEFIEVKKSVVKSDFEKCKGFQASYPMFRDLLKLDELFLNRYKFDSELKECIRQNNIIGIVNQSAVWNRQIVKKYFEELEAKGELDGEKESK